MSVVKSTDSSLPATEGLRHRHGAAQDLLAQPSHAPPGTGSSSSGNWNGGLLYQQIHSAIFMGLTAVVSLLDAATQVVKGCVNRLWGTPTPLARKSTPQDLPRRSNVPSEQAGTSRDGHVEMVGHPHGE